MSAVPATEVYAAALHHGGCACMTEQRWVVRYDDGRVLPLAPQVQRWRSELDAVDGMLLRRTTGSVVDVGCGPGRLVAALHREGRRALGVDIAEAAVALARASGATVLAASVFDRLPSEGEWDTVLLADGNIGIGGDPAALLRRCRELLVHGGRMLVETDPPGRPSGRCRVRLESPDAVSQWFPWAHVPAEAMRGLAREAALAVEDQWASGGRWFATLVT